MTAPAVPASLLDQFVERAGSLFSLPAVAVEVLELTAPARVDTRALKACVERDPALTGKLLRVVNSSLFGLSREVTDLNQALALLGVKPLKLLVLGFSLPQGLFSGIDADALEHYWRCTLVKAVAARELSQAYWKAVGDEAFIAGLLQDIGMLVLVQELGDSYLNFLHGVWRQKADLRALEEETLGFNHTQLSARLLEHWKLPASLVEAVGATPPGSPRTPLPAGDSPLPRILHLSTLIAAVVIDGRDEALAELLHMADHYRAIRVEQIDALLESIQDSVSTMATLFAVRLDAQESYRDILVRAHAAMAQVACEAVPDLLRGSAAAASRVDCRPLSEAAARFANGQFPRGAPAAATQQRAVAASPNDPGLLGRADAAIAQCRAQHCELSLLLVEVDDLGDQLVREGMEHAARLESLLRAHVQDLYELPHQCLLITDARIAVLLVDCDRLHAVALARQLIDRLAGEGTGRSEVHGPIACSAGVATLAVPTRSSRADDLVAAAERCLFAARKSGGGVVKSIDVLC